jgi:hypothetical protein
VVLLSDERTSGAEPVEVLRAKYYDFCSARVADVLLELSPDEIYVLAEEASRTRPVRGDLDYDRMVRLATERISGNLGLPSFEEWRQRYLEDPEAMDAMLIGLWRTDQ